MHRYSRQIILPQIGGVGQKKLQTSHLCLVGAGAVGYPFFLYGSGSGIQQWTLLEPDPSLAERLVKEARRRDPSITVTVLPFAHLADTLNSGLQTGQWSAVVEASNDFAIHHKVVTLCHRQPTPLHTAWLSAGIGWLACSPCPCSLPPPSTSPHRASPFEAMGMGLIGTQLAQQVILTILGNNPTEKKAPWQGFQLESGTFSTQQANCGPECPTCRDGSTP